MDYREYVDVLTPSPEARPLIVGGVVAYLLTSWLASPLVAAWLDISGEDAMYLLVGLALMGFLAYLTSIRPRLVDM